MKITIDVDCTPQEARVFLGLPDVKPMQDVLMDQMRERLSANLAAVDPETLFKTWLPAGLQNLEALQRIFWAQIVGNRGGGSDGKDGGD